MTFEKTQDRQDDNPGQIHLLSAFDLRAGVEEDSFADAYHSFVQELYDAGLIIDARPMGRRVPDTPMDTDDTRAQQFFTILTFRDRAHMDAAYAHIEARMRAVTGEHAAMYARTANQIFTCWQDEVSFLKKGTP
ncbi:MAG: DUF6614 family protein [Pseudomonadota bacterium]